MNNVMTPANVIIMTAICCAITFILRAIPFVFFSGGKVPRIITYLGQVLPCAVMVCLVVYCVKSVDIFTIHTSNGWLAPLVGIISVVFLHLWKRNTLLSIVGGTAIYMILFNLLK